MDEPSLKQSPLDEAVRANHPDGGRGGFRGFPLAKMEQSFDSPHDDVSRRMTVYATMPDGIAILIEAHHDGECFEVHWDCPEHPEERPDKSGCPRNCARFVFTPAQAKERYPFLEAVIDQATGGVGGGQDG